MNTDIIYKVGNNLNVDQVIDLYITSTLGDRRPVENKDCMTQMLEHSNLVVTAWEDDLLIGISRSLTDFCYVAYLSDLAIRESHQKMGIGKELIRRTKQELGANATLVLLSAPAARNYYPKIGMKPHPSAWVLTASDELT